MRIKINLEPVGERINLPVHYNHILQAFIYRNLSQTLADKIHSQGFAYKKRQFRLFTFSRLFGHFLRDGDTISYQGSLSLWIASSLTEILESFASHLVRKGRIKLGDGYCRISGVEVAFAEDYGNCLTIKMLSPMTIYSTLLTSDKKKKTYYYSPFEEDFSRICHQNLLKKYHILKKEPFVSAEQFSLIPERVTKKNEHIIIYKGTVIKAWSGIYRLTAPKELLAIAFDCGLGAKNSQGFGMIEKYMPKA